MTRGDAARRSVNERRATLSISLWYTFKLQQDCTVLLELMNSARFEKKQEYLITFCHSVAQCASARRGARWRHAAPQPRLSYVALLLAEMKSSSSTAAYVCGMMVILRMFAPVGFARETFFHAEKTIERVAKLHNQERSAAAALRRDLVTYFTE